MTAIDLDSLEIDKDSYVSKELRTAYSDLVYRVRHRNGELFVCLLFEHKSHSEFWTLLQLLRYIAAQGDEYRKQHPDAERLPPVYPIVIYHRAERWEAPSSFHGLVEPLPDDIKGLVPSFSYHLVDLSERTNAEIKGAVLTRLAQLALRWVFSNQPIERLRELLILIEQIDDRETAVEVLESLLRYYVQGTGAVEEPQVPELLQQTSTGEPIMQTFIDRYIEQGREQGLEQGIEQGIDLGRKQGGEAALLRLIERRFGRPSDAVRSRIKAADAETLLDWSERILTADSIDAALS